MNARGRGPVEHGLLGEAAFGRQPLRQLGQKCARVRILQLDPRTALVEQDRLLAVAVGQAAQRLGGDRAAGAMQLERADQHFQQHAQVPVPDAEADEQEALADPLERADQAVGQRRPLGDDRDQEVEQVVLAQDERAGFLGIAEQVIDQRGLGRARQQELGVVALVAAQVVALDDRILARGLERLRQQVVLAGGQDQAERQRRERSMDLGGDEARRLVEFLRQRPQRVGAEAFGVLVLLRDRGQGSAADPPVVFFELRSERGGQRLGEAAGGSARKARRQRCRPGFPGQGRGCSDRAGHW